MNVKFPHSKIICNDLLQRFCKEANAKPTVLSAAQFLPRPVLDPTLSKPCPLHTQPTYVLSRIITTHLDYFASFQVTIAVFLQTFRSSGMSSTVSHPRRTE